MDKLTPFNGSEKLSKLMKNNKDLYSQEELKQAAAEKLKRFNEETRTRQRYDVWKISLPRGHVEQPVMINVSEYIADQFVDDVSKTQLITIKDSDRKILILYEKYLTGTKKPDFYANPRPITKEDKENTIVLPETNKEIKEWVD